MKYALAQLPALEHTPTHSCTQARTHTHNTRTHADAHTCTRCSLPLSPPMTQDHDLLPDLEQERDLQSPSEEPRSGESYPLMNHSTQFTYIPPEEHRNLNPGVEVTAV